MKTSYRILSFSLLAALFLAITLFFGCKKENPQATIKQTVLEENRIQGFLGDEQILIQTNASYFTDSSRPNLAGVSTAHIDDADEDNTHHGEENDEDEDDKTMLVTGCEWHTTDLAGNSATTGTVQLRKEVFRIYVTPFLSSRYYGMVQAGTYSFAYVDNSKNGAFITLLDKSGVTWTSKGEQQGSSFQILTRGANQNTFTTITGTVTCKMYDASGNMKPFTGTFSALVGL